VNATAIVSFRRDLRLHDHPALVAACAGHARVIPLFVLDDHLLHGERWLRSDLDHYAERHDALSHPVTSILSPYLRWGCLSARECRGARIAAVARGPRRGRGNWPGATSTPTSCCCLPATSAPIPATSAPPGGIGAMDELAACARPSRRGRDSSRFALGSVLT
jgi:hypothetical protein